MGNTNKHILTYSPIKMYQRLYSKIISILYRMGENTVAILHIYGARAIFILFNDDQDTKNE